MLALLLGLVAEFLKLLEGGKIGEPSVGRYRVSPCSWRWLWGGRRIGCLWPSSTAGEKEKNGARDPWSMTL